eukprot:TRINITY_DN33575_c0_g1_i1.p3 TRINITY_DN33575_c0_g1~~TRINITY_DN33575_c0_g1_i1.p3  ORF type:complete len:130 (-),score=41.11 TRINITY_DN33575_c0_g1_i1:275-664(-)
MQLCVYIFFFSSRRRHTRCREVSWARRCVQETGTWEAHFMGGDDFMDNNDKKQKITLTEEEAEIAAETILNAWLKGERNIVTKNDNKEKQFQKGIINENKYKKINNRFNFFSIQHKFIGLWQKQSRKYF